MTTFRIHHQQHFTTISNQAIRDSRLSFKARGLHHLLLSYPDDWEVNLKHLSSQSDVDGRTAIAAGIRELIEAGYIIRRQTREAGRFSSVDYDVYELPQPQSDVAESRKPENGASPQSGFPHTGFPCSENPDQRNTEYIRNTYLHEKPQSESDDSSLETALPSQGDTAALNAGKEARHRTSIQDNANNEICQEQSCRPESHGESKVAQVDVAWESPIPLLGAEDPVAESMNASAVRHRIWGESRNDWNVPILREWVLLWEEARRNPGPNAINLKSFIRKNLHPNAPAHGSMLDELEAVEGRLTAKSAPQAHQYQAAPTPAELYFQQYGAGINSN